MQVKIGTRSSKLAMWQAEHVCKKLTSAGHPGELIKIKSEGDIVQDVPLHQVGLPGVFTRSLDEAIIGKKVHVAVHSAKDMPSALPEELEVIAFLKREDPRDVLLATSEEVNLENFSRSWVIGTSSLRRSALLRYYFDHVEVKNIRGNVDTRISKLKSGQYDGIMLAFAGVKRLGLENYVVQKFNLNAFTPAIGQGAIAVVGRKDFQGKNILRKALNHPDTEHALICERAFLRAINGGCQTPAFAYAHVTGETLTILGGIASEDGRQLYRKELEGTISEAADLGQGLARFVLEAVR